MVGPFQDTNEIIGFGRRFLSERTDSLRHDVQICIANTTAAFPAILYSFSTIDLLGALLGGDAKSPRGTTDRAKAYMRRFMRYSEDECVLLMDLFRHKIVHLAQPGAVISFRNAKVTWHYWHDDATHHLKLVALDPPRRITVASALAVSADQEFQVSIRHLADDVIESVHTPRGYLHSLGSDPDLQAKFAKAVREIYCA